MIYQQRIIYLSKRDILLSGQGLLLLVRNEKNYKMWSDFIYRYHHGFKYCGTTTGKVIDIYKLVKGKENLRSE
ncbi:MAG: hypothetical protein IPG01_16790 [Chitinophagaceae bacterium]|nr:hypothetical protein [Chitinophagaceae bacterium]